MDDQRRVEIESGRFRLEGVLRLPSHARAVTVVCHPHPLNGGDMENNVVMAIVEGALEGGLGTLNFNFRGVGQSQGAYDNGVGEEEDVRAALAFARESTGLQSIALTGYSFGARMAAAAVDEGVAALALVAAPGRDFSPYERLKDYEGPILFVTGESDTISSLDVIRAGANQLAANIEVIAVPGVDHFWWGHEDRLAVIIRDFFARALA